MSSLMITGILLLVIAVAVPVVVEAFVVSPFTVVAPPAPSSPKLTVFSSSNNDENNNNNNKNSDERRPPRRRNPNNNDHNKNNNNSNETPPKQLPSFGLSSFDATAAVARKFFNDTTMMTQEKPPALVDRKFELQYTCKVCETRNSHKVSRIGMFWFVLFVVSYCLSCFFVCLSIFIDLLVPFVGVFGVGWLLNYSITWYSVQYFFPGFSISLVPPPFPLSPCTHKISYRAAYNKGVVITMCKGCLSQHLISDHLQFTGLANGNLEDFLMTEEGGGGDDEQPVVVQRVTEEVFQLEKILAIDTSSGSILDPNGNAQME